jgi:hypothetical protein
VVDNLIVVPNSRSNRASSPKAASDDELERLRAIMARAHEKADPFNLRKIFAKLTSRFRSHIQKKAIVERIETEPKKKDAA